MPWQVYNSAGQLLQAKDLPDSTVTASKLATNAVTNAYVLCILYGIQLPVSILRLKCSRQMETFL